MSTRTPLTAFIIGLMLVGCQAQARSAQAGYSAADLYNAANAYARAGKPGMAVLHYERARLLAPNDPDIEANLRLVREPLRLPSESRNALARAVTLASPTTIAWIGVLGLLIVGVSLLAGQIHRRPRLGRHRLMRRAATVVGTSMIGLTVVNGVVLWPRLHEAVVIARNTAVRVSPAPMGDPLFILPEAETVTMKAEHEGFVLVESRAGRTGWAARASLAPVVPFE
jgi:hypothetical protein